MHEEVEWAEQHSEEPALLIDDEWGPRRVSLIGTHNVLVAISRLCKDAFNDHMGLAVHERTITGDGDDLTVTVSMASRGDLLPNEELSHLGNDSDAHLRASRAYQLVDSVLESLRSYTDTGAPVPEHVMLLAVCALERIRADFAVACGT